MVINVDSVTVCGFRAKRIETYPIGDGATGKYRRHAADSKMRGRLPFAA